MFIAGMIISAAAVVMAMTLGGMMAHSQHVRRAHDIPNPEFFRDGSGLVFGTLGAVLLLGLALVFLSR